MKKCIKLFRAIEGDVIVTFLDSSDALKALMRERKLSFLQGEKFFEVLSFAVYLASFFKEEEDRLLFKLKGEDFEIFADAEKDFFSGRVEGEIFEGGGLLSLTRISGGMPVNSAFETESMNLSEEFSRFFRASEQRDFALFFMEGGKGALFLEALPNAQAGSVQKIAQEIPKDIDLQGALSLFGTFSERELNFRCRCGKVKARAAVLSLGQEDALSLLKEEGKIEVRCPECGKKYTFFEEEIKKLFKIHG